MKHQALKTLALASTTLVALSSTAFAQTSGAQDITLKTAQADIESNIVQNSASAQGFKISMNGETLAGGGFNYEDKKRATDVALYDANVQIKNDGLDNAPYLNVAAKHNAVRVERAMGTTFQPFWNYGSFIESAEVRIFDAYESTRNAKPLAVLPIENGTATLAGGTEMPNDLIYVLRTYGAEGRFDETEPKPLKLTDEAQSPAQGSSALASYGIDRTSFRNIQLKGATVTVFGDDVPANSIVNVMGVQVPTDADGKFVRDMILPYGSHTVGIDIAGDAKTVSFARDIHIDSADFFYVAIGDVTLGNQSSDGAANYLASNGQDFSDYYLSGRGAMYAKGRVKGGYDVTAAIDTGEDRLSNLFKNLDDKDPRQLLRRLDSDRFYPVYGDDSTTVEDAPTQGRFYLRVEKDDSHVMWGNFATQITSTEFAHLDRGLYGAIVDHKSVDTTAYGERRTQITAFAADPGTLPSLEEFRGTGGSVYFLNRQDLSIGSERLRVEIRDKVSGLVTSTRDLRPHEDYEIDYIQGRVLLNGPLQSTVNDNQLVRTGELSGNDLFLVVRYEYTPSLTDVGGYTVGGRATHWVGDSLRLGLTAQNEETGAADQQLYGVDAVVRRSTGTYIKAELAQTKGAAFGQSNSSNGGFDFNNTPTAGQANDKAVAYRVEGAVNLSEVSEQDGKIGVYYDHQDAGFSGSNRFIPGETDRWGAHLDVSLGENTHVTAKYDEIDSDLRGSTRAIYGDVSQQIGEDLALSVGIRHDDQDVNGVGINPVSVGSRTDISGQVDYAMSKVASVFGFVQATLDRDSTRGKNNRAGIGGSLVVNDKLAVSGEVSEGTGGFGASAQATYTRNDTSEFYMGYVLAADDYDNGLLSERQNLTDNGTVTFGGRTRYSNSLSVYGEERFGLGSRQSSMTHAYGVTFNPSEKWTLGASVENGTIKDDVTGNFDRTAFSVSAGRTSDTVRFATNLEARFEDGVQNGNAMDRTTWLMRNTAAFDANQDWEVLGRLNFAISDSDQSNFRDADFVEGVLGAAYRPVDNERLNALFKYTYFEDLAPAGQISSSGQTALPRQKSQVLSVDAIYDLTAKLSIGGKYGYRSGEVAFDRTDNSDFIKSNAHLAVARIDYHVIEKWDLLAEGRILSSDLADDKRIGALLGIYRHFQDNMKVGVGYNFAKFSDDLTNYKNDNDGFFINLVGKF
ncbi:MAG: TonB-dependent receptor [Maricaulaceae bacterium]